MHINWKIAGRAGEGIAVTGHMFAKTCIRHGLNVFNYGEYPSLIRGGHNTAQISASVTPLSCHFYTVDVLVALKLDAVDYHRSELAPASRIIIDLETVKLDLHSYPDLVDNFCNVPLVQLAREATGGSLAANVVAIGVSCWLLGLSIDVFAHVIKDAFESKGDKVVQANIAAARLGFAYAEKQEWTRQPLISPSPKGGLLVTGNEAIGLAALSAGVQFYSSYPMTPTSSLLHFFAEHEQSFPIVVKHAEDEVAAINQAIGASYAGVRAMTGTAGGGFALMVEGVSFAGIAETPLVVVEGQRPGPATGLPTWTSQADLQFVLRAGHGEFPKVVLAPGDIEECLSLTRLAFELAEKYQTQVYLVGDKYLLESSMSAPVLVSEYQNARYSFATDKELLSDGSYRRFADTNTGYSPRSVPGMPFGQQMTNSYEHDEFGYSTEDADMTKRMVQKRLRKLKGLQQELPGVVEMGAADAPLTLICWGSTKLVLMEVLRQSKAKLGIQLRLVHLPTLWPFPAEALQRALSTAPKTVIVEGNATGQAEMLIREQTGLQIDHHLRRYDGRPFYVEDVLAELRKLL